jgi:hypothetical protein
MIDGFEFERHGWEFFYEQIKMARMGNFDHQT